jgi:hypothetical protein
MRTAAAVAKESGIMSELDIEDYNENVLEKELEENKTFNAKKVTVYPLMMDG